MANGSSVYSTRCRPCDRLATLENTRLTAITADRVRKLCRAAFRTRTDSYGMDIRHWLLDLHKMEETGWSPDALPMIQLASDTQWHCELWPSAIETTRFGLIRESRRK